MVMVNEGILARLRDFISDKGWSQAEFARRMGIRAQHVKRYLTGVSDVQALFLKLYEQGCDINWLISGHSTESYNTVIDKDANDLIMTNELAESLIKRIESLEAAQAGRAEADATMRARHVTGSGVGEIKIFKKRKPV